MNKNIKLKIAIFTILLIMISLVTNITNAYSVGVTMTSDKSLSVGEEILVTVKIKDLVVGNGIDAFMGTINYDKNVFETLSSQSLVSTNGWNPVFNPKTNIFTLLRNSKIANESDIMAIKFKVKSSINVYDTEIKLTNMSASGGAEIDGGTGDIYLSDSKLTIARNIQLPAQTNTVSQSSSSQSNAENKNSTIMQSIDGKSTTEINNENSNNTNVDMNVDMNDIYNNVSNNNENSGLTDNMELYNLLADTNNTANSELEKINHNKNIVLLILALIILASGICGYKLYKIKIQKNQKQK